MSRDVVASSREQPALDGAGLRVAVVCGRFNDHVTVRLLEGVRRGLRGCEVADDDVTEVWVPGSFELPATSKAFAESGAVDAVVCIGCVIRGDTAHFDLVAGECARGIQQVGLDTGMPIVFGVLTTENLDQALCRSEPAGGHNVGEEAAQTAVEMARLLVSISKLRT
ncbi:MAG TPA: 6,7-dimethyl-8-ribityllumazine synthase [Acidimicrobiales bacterium]|jgi:6,7-dimethyl-8-ribityllumazine synthase|nr:6,7-dimethyl-8-ribityllumazine synthase [Acidimicrobiales bacterium]